jgi:hypothetical protein
MQPKSGLCKSALRAGNLNLGAILMLVLALAFLFVFVYLYSELLAVSFRLPLYFSGADKSSITSLLSFSTFSSVCT